MNMPFYKQDLQLIQFVDFLYHIQEQTITFAKALHFIQYCHEKSLSKMLNVDQENICLYIASDDDEYF